MASKSNFREVVMRRLSTVQEQKQSLNRTPMRYSASQTDSWKAEKDILMEMLEKTQKLQISSQQAWSQERENWERQYKHLEAFSKAQFTALKQENDRLLGELAKVKSMETAELGSKSDLTRQLQELKQRYLDREQSLTEQISALQSCVEDYKEGLARAKDDMEKKRVSAEEKSSLIEAKAVEAVSTLRKDLTRLQSLLKEKDETIRSQAQEATLTRSLLETLKRRKVTKTVTVQTEDSRQDLKAGDEGDWVRREEKERQLQVSINSLQQQLFELQESNSSLQTALSAAQQPLPTSSLEALLPHVAKAIEVLLVRSDIDVKALVETLQGEEGEGRKWREAVQYSEEVCSRVNDVLNSLPSNSERKCRAVVEIYSSSLKALLETARSLRPDSNLPSLLVQIDTEKLRRERDFLLSELQEDKTGLREVISKLEALSSLLQGGLELRERLNRAVLRLSQAWPGPFPTPLLQQLLAALQGQSNVGQLEQQRDRLEAAFGHLKVFHEEELERLSLQFASFQALVHTERSRTRESLLKIAEAVEYRQAIWEQYQSAEETEEIAEELERQTLWEIKALEGLIEGLGETAEVESTQSRETVTVIKEASEEEEEDLAPVVVRLG